MRHQKKGRKLGVNPSHRKALLRNLASNLIKHKRIQTTDSRAKELRTFIEPLITKAKKADFNSTRLILKKLPFDENLTGKEDRYWANKIVKKKLNYLYDPSLIAEHQYTANGNTWKGIG